MHLEWNNELGTDRKAPDDFEGVPTLLQYIVEPQITVRHASSIRKEPATDMLMDQYDAIRNTEDMIPLLPYIQCRTLATWPFEGTRHNH